ncbi:MAG: hypothetical protein ACRDGS_11610, partial [Chloroflexota bacterium]
VGAPLVGALGGWPEGTHEGCPYLPASSGEENVGNDETWRPALLTNAGVMLGILSRGNLIVAGERSSFWQEQVELLRVSPGWEEARQVYGDGQGGLNLALFFDLIAVHELAHAFEWQGSVRFPRHWLKEFFATSCLHA